MDQPVAVSGQSVPVAADVPSMLVPPVMLLNSARVITHVTDPVVGLLGCRDRHDILGRRGRDFWVHQDRVEPTVEEFKRAGYWHGSFLARRSDGSGRTLYGKAWMLRGGGDYQIVMLLAATDSALELFSMFGQAGTVTVPELIIRGIVHDLNNAMSLPVGMITMLRDSIPEHDKEAREMAGSISDACQYLSGIVRQLGEWANAWSDRSTAKKHTDMGELITQAARMAVMGSGLELRLHVPQGLWGVECEQAGILRVLVNLLLNARQATGPGGVLSVSAENMPGGGAAGRWVKMSITDSGRGIDAGDIEQVFAAGFTTKPDGHGLGLAISDHIVREHGGRIAVRSVKGRGTTFEVWLPAGTSGKPQRASGAEDMPLLSHRSGHGAGTGNRRTAQ